MIIEQLISPVVPILQPTDTGNRALSLMEQNALSQLPLVMEDKYVALINENDVLDWEDPEAQLSEANFLHYKPAVQVSGHPYEALRVAHNQNLSVVPIVDRENIYKGAITRNDLLKYITENSGLDNPGGIIVMEIAPRDYSLQQIARICEGEEVLIISSQLFSNKMTGKFEVTIKTNKTSLDGAVNALERYNFKVLAVYGEESSKDHLLDRYNNLMNYLDI